VPRGQLEAESSESKLETRSAVRRACPAARARGQNNAKLGYRDSFRVRVCALSLHDSRSPRPCAGREARSRGSCTVATVVTVRNEQSFSGPHVGVEFWASGGVILRLNRSVSAQHMRVWLDSLETLPSNIFGPAASFKRSEGHIVLNDFKDIVSK
jgi:hypothetical protein